MIKYDKKRSFKSIFDPATGFYLRTGILHKGGDTGIDPFMASYPELIDVGIMGSCLHGRAGLCLKAGVQCYQDGLHSSLPNMSLENFRRIAEESKGKAWQFALGGAGDPDQHEFFEDILAICKNNDIVPNFTSSGFGFNNRTIDLCKKYCGAVAVSWYRSDYTVRAINMLIEAGIKTNIHYVLGKNSIEEAINRLRGNSFPKGINAVIFLLHKPIGLGTKENLINLDDEKVRVFFNIIDSGRFPFKIGFDSCTVPGLLQYCSNIAMETVDTCEGGRWSMYITPDMKALPCSFDNQDKRWSYDISNASIQDAWDSAVFEDFRNHFIKACPTCENRSECMGGCPICPEIVLCDSKART